MDPQLASERLWEPAPDETPQDQDLVRRLLAGDEEAFETLVAAHHGALLRLARVFVSSPDLAEEVVQETWLAVLRGLSRFEGRSSLKTWIFHILANRARTRGAREARMVPLENPDGPSPNGAGIEAGRFDARGGWVDPPARWQADTPEAILLRQEAAAHLSGVIEALPAMQRLVVTLRDIEGLSPEEVCRVLEVSESNQRVLLHRGRARVRRALEDVLGVR